MVKLGVVSLVGVLGLVAGCPGTHVAEHLLDEPEFDPKDQTKCKVQASQTKPRIQATAWCAGCAPRGPQTQSPDTQIEGRSGYVG